VAFGVISGLAGGAFFFLTESSFFAGGVAESELEFVLEALVLFPFLLLAGVAALGVVAVAEVDAGIGAGAEASELSESELLESLPEDEDDELSLLLEDVVVSSDELTCVRNKENSLKLNKWRPRCCKNALASWTSFFLLNDYCTLLVVALVCLFEGAYLHNGAKTRSTYIDASQ